MTWELSILIVGIALLTVNTIMVYAIWERLEDKEDE